MTAKAWAYMKSGATDETSTSLFLPPSSFFINLQQHHDELHMFQTPNLFRFDKSGNKLTKLALLLNRKSYNDILFRPRIMVDVETCNTSCKMMGEETSLPVFISPAGMAGLAHPQGERVLAKAAGECGMIQMVSDRGPRS